MHLIMAHASWQTVKTQKHSAEIQKTVKGDVDAGQSGRRAYYRIRVEGAGAGQSWMVDRRYKEFLTLYASLPRQYEGGPRLPAMPPKSTFRKMLIPGFMRARMRGLNAVLQAAVAGDPSLTKYPALRDFLGKVADRPSTSPCATSVAQVHPGQAVAAASVAQAYPVPAAAQPTQALDYSAPSAPAYEAPTTPLLGPSTLEAHLREMDEHVRALTRRTSMHAEPAVPVSAQPGAPAYQQPAVDAPACAQASPVHAQPAAAAPVYAPATQPAFAAPECAPSAQVAVAAPVSAPATQPAFAAPGQEPYVQPVQAPMYGQLFDTPMYAPTPSALFDTPMLLERALEEIC